MLYNYSYLHLGPTLFKCIRSCPHFFLVYFIFFNLIQPFFFSGFTKKVDKLLYNIQHDVVQVNDRLVQLRLDVDQIHHMVVGNVDDENLD
jgi:hypothetical protein